MGTEHWTTGRIVAWASREISYFTVVFLGNLKRENFLSSFSLSLSLLLLDSYHSYHTFFFSLIPQKNSEPFKTIFQQNLK